MAAQLGEFKGSPTEPVISLLGESMKLYLSAELTLSQQPEITTPSKKRNPYIDDSDGQGRRSLAHSEMVEDSTGSVHPPTLSLILAAIEKNTNSEQLESIAKAIHNRKESLERILGTRNISVSELKGRFGPKSKAVPILTHSKAEEIPKEGNPSFKVTLANFMDESSISNVPHDEREFTKELRWYQLHA